MIYRPIFKGGPQVSVIGLGTHQFSGEWDKIFTQKDVDKIINTAGERGVNFIDTAPNYGNHLSEKFIGDVVKNNRTDWFIASKFGISMLNNGKDFFNYSLKSVSRQLEKSLKSLNTLKS